MFEKIEIFRLAHGLAAHATQRQAVIARNVANADTPGYQARDIRPFEQTFQSSAQPGLRRTRPGHLGGETGVSINAKAFVDGAETSPNGNSVSLEGEMVKAAETRQEHEMALAVYSTALNILRSSLGH